MTRYEVHLDRLEVDPSWLIGARTYAMDRWVPEVELIRQPGRIFEAEVVVVTADEAPALSTPVYPADRWKKLRQKLSPPPVVDLGARLLFDTRQMDNFFNWSHHLNYYAPLAVCLRSTFGIDMSVAIMDGMPAVLSELYALLGFAVIATDAQVRARHLRWDRDDRAKLCNGHSALLAEFQDQLDATYAAIGGGRRYDRVFLPRRGSRRIANEAEIEALLHRHGFVTFYPEALSAAEQLRMWNEASWCVAIHGAAIAPVQWRAASSPPLRLIELCPVGMMTQFFRTLAYGAGADYVAVRGMLKRDYVDGFYRYGTPLLRHSFDDFGVDPFSLELALHLAAGGEIQNDMPRNWTLTAP